MADEPMNGEVSTLFVPCTITVSDGRIIALRPNPQTGRCYVTVDPDRNGLVSFRVLSDEEVRKL